MRPAVLRCLARQLPMRVLRQPDHVRRQRPSRCAAPHRPPPRRCGRRCRRPPPARSSPPHQLPVDHRLHPRGRPPHAVARVRHRPLLARLRDRAAPTVRPGSRRPASCSSCRAAHPTRAAATSRCSSPDVTRSASAACCPDGGIWSGRWDRSTCCAAPSPPSLEHPLARAATPRCAASPRRGRPRARSRAATAPSRSSRSPSVPGSGRRRESPPAAVRRPIVAARATTTGVGADRHSLLADHAARTGRSSRASPRRLRRSA